MKKISKLLICILLVALLIPMGVAFADEDYCCALSYKTIEDENGNFDIDFIHFDTNEEYKDFVNNQLKGKDLDEYNLDIYTDNFDILLKEAKSVFVRGGNHKVTISTKSVVLKLGSIEELSLDGCLLTGDYEFTVSDSCRLNLSNGTIYDGLNNTYDHSIINLEMGGRVELDYSYIQNFNLTNGAEIIDFKDYIITDPMNETFLQGYGIAEFNNIHSDGNGILEINNDMDRINGIQFIECSSDENGGVVHFKNGRIRESLFQDCVSGEDGGAIYVEPSDYQKCYLVNCIFENNYADKGGAIYLKADYFDSLFLSGCTISGNHAKYGGGIYVDAPGTDIKNSNFTANSADNDGGAIYINQEDAEILDCKIHSNSAGTDGGAICINDDRATIKDCSFENNRAYDDGGAAYVCVGCDDAKFIGCTFYRNRADDSNNDVDGRSDTIISETGSAISSGSSWLIICIVGALIFAFVLLYVLKKRNSQKD